MKQNLNYLLYGIALILILIPIALEQMGKSASAGQEILLPAGLFLLIAGKVVSLKKKRTQGISGSSIFQDLLIIACLLAMMVWMFIKG